MKQKDQNISQEVQQNDQNITPGSETKKIKTCKKVLVFQSSLRDGKKYSWPSLRRVYVV